MLTSFFRRFEKTGLLSHDNARALQQVASRTRRLEAGQDLLTEGERAAIISIITSGFACRYKSLPNGTRQITAFLVPGDVSLPVVFLARAMGHSIGSLSSCKVIDISRDRLAELIATSSGIAHLFQWIAFSDAAIMQERLVSLGRRSAIERIAHLLCEFLVRLERVGLAQDNSYAFPLTQNELADAMGISTVHVNRVLQTLRRDGLITLACKRVIVHDRERLMTFCGFDASYLGVAANQVDRASATVRWGGNVINRNASPHEFPHFSADPCRHGLRR